MYFIANLNKNYSFIAIYFVIKECTYAIRPKIIGYFVSFFPIWHPSVSPFSRSRCSPRKAFRFYFNLYYFKSTPSFTKREFNQQQ